MKKHTFKELLEATRYWTFYLSVMPAIAAAAFLLSRHLVPSGGDTIIKFILFIIGVVVLHAAANLVQNKSEAKEYLLFSMILFVIGGTIGLYLVMKTGYVLLAIGCLGVGLSIIFSYLRSKALGGLALFVVCPVLVIIAVAYCLTGTPCYESLILSVPIGALTLSSAHAYNACNMEKDAGVRTLAAIMGGEASAHLYRIYMLLPFLSVILYVIFGYLHPLSLISLIAALPAYYSYMAARRYNELGVKCMEGLDQASAKLQFLFTGFLSAGLFMSSVI